MFGRSRPVVIEPHGPRRGKGRLPRWLVLLHGAAIGVGALLYVQERHLPPRSSAAGSADAERANLRSGLAEASTGRDAALAEGKRLAGEIAAVNRDATKLRLDVDFLIDALPAG